MANTPTVYVFCNNNCKYEGLTKEQIFTAIMQAVNEGTIGDIDTGFVTTIKTINGSPLKFFVGTQAEYEALTEEQREGLYAIITNDTTAASIIERLDALAMDYDQYKESINNEFAGIGDGRNIVGDAYHAHNADLATAARCIEADDGTKFGRKTLWKNTTTVIGESSTGFMSAGTTNTLDLSAVATTLANKWLVAVVRKLKKNDLGLYDIEHSFRTCAFCPTTADNVTDGKENGFAQSIGGTTLTFFVNGSTLYYISSNGAYFLYKIYEEQ